MKSRFKALAVASVLAIQQAHAGAGFDLSGAGLGIFTALSGDNPLAAGSIVQLIWSADAVAADNTVWDGAGYLSQGDYLLFSGVSADYMTDQGSAHSAGGGWSTDLDGGAVYNNAQVGAQNIQNGFVYGRVFNAAALGAGIVYGQTTLLDVSNESTNVPPDLPQTVNYHAINAVYDDDVNPSAFDGGTALVMGQAGVFTTVPEPSVFAFLGVGAVVLGLRRRFTRS